MKTFWTKDCKTDSERDKRKRDLERAKKGFGHLRTVVLERLKAAEAEREDPDFSSPAWAYKQADLNATIRVLKSMLDTLDDVC